MGLIQPITVRPNSNGFEIVAGARRFRAAQLAELFSLPARIVDIDDAQTLEWQLVENSQRVDVHPYEEAQGFQRLLDMPGYDIATLVEKSGKSPAHVYARLSLLQLAPPIAEAFSAELITASHASLLALLPQDVQADAYEQCWRKDWQDNEPHLLPVKHLSAWIQTNLYLNLADAPFDKEDTTLNPTAGACITCPRRSGFNTSLFADVQGDQCLDAPCFHLKVNAHIDREIAARPQLVQIEDGWRKPSEKRPDAVQRGHFREVELDNSNPDAEPVLPCAAAKTALVVYGKRVGTTLTVCTDDHCPIHDPAAAARLAEQEAETSTPMAAPAPKRETDEQTAQREALYVQQRKEQEAEDERRAEERRRRFEPEQQEHEAEQQRRDALQKQRETAFECIRSHAPATFSAAQLRLFLLCCSISTRTASWRRLRRTSPATVNRKTMYCWQRLIPLRKASWGVLPYGSFSPITWASRAKASRTCSPKPKPLSSTQAEKAGQQARRQQIANPYERGQEEDGSEEESPSLNPTAAGAGDGSRNTPQRNVPVT